MSDTKVHVGGELRIATSNRLFVKLTQIGQCDAKGRAVYAAGYDKKWIAEPDRPIRTLILPLLQTLLDFAKYDDRAEFDADLAALKRFVEGLHVVDKKKPEKPTA